MMYRSAFRKPEKWVRNVDSVGDYDYEYLERLHNRIDDPEEQELISRALFG